MPTFSRDYIEPGVYVTSEIKPTPTIGTVGNFVPILIGTMDTHKKVESDLLTYSSSPTLIKYKGENVNYNNIRTNGAYVIDNLGYKFDITNDFIISENDDGYAVIIWNTDKKPNTDVYRLYFYLKKDINDYKPKFFYASQYQDAIDFLGKIEFDANDELKYSLPLGVTLAINNGASSVWCVSSKDESGNDKNIIDILQEITSLKNPDGSYPYTIVYLGGYQANVTSDIDLSVVSSIIQHVRVMSSVEEQKERIAIFGPPKGADQEPNFVDNYSLTLTQLKDRRVVYCYPSDLMITIDNKTYVVGGYFLAAALAGLIDSIDISSPFTGALVNGFSSIIDEKLKTEKNSLAKKGCLIVEDNARIRHALTTDQTNAITGELKITRIIDYITRIVRSSLEGFANQPYSTGLLSTIAMSIKLLLTQLLNANVIIDYRNIEVKRNDLEPRQVDVTFEVRPTFDVNWIFVKFTVEI